MGRYGRLLLMGIFLLAGYTGYSQPTSPPPYTIVATQLVDNSVDDGASLDVVKIQVLDASGNPVGNISITVQINGSSNTTVLTTDAAGDPVFFQQGNLSTAPPLTIAISIQVGGVSIATTSVIFHYVAGPPVLNPPPGSPNPSFYIVTGNNAAANGTDTDGIMIHVVDGNGQNYPPNTPISFTITSANPASGSMLFNHALYQTTYHFFLGPAGNRDIPLTDLVPGDVTITASVTDLTNGITYTFPNPVTVTFVDPNPSPGNSSYTTIIPSAPDDGSDTTVVRVHLVGASSGGPVAANTLVYFTVTSTGPASTNAMLNTTTTTTFSEPIGAFAVTGNTIDLPITDLSAGSVTISASVMVGGVLTPISGSPQTVTFTAGPPIINQPTNPTYFTTVTNNQPADGVSQDVVKVYLADASGSGVANFPVTFTITSNNTASTNALFDPPPSGTPTSTTVTVNTTLNSDPAGPGYIILPLTDLQLGSVTITATFTIAGTTYTIPVDQTVNFVTGPAVPSDPTIPVPPGGGGGSGGSGTGPSNPSDPAGPGKGFTYLAMTFNDVPADGVATDTATAYITDAQGRPVAGAAVIFTFHTGGPANGGALFQPQAETTDTVYTNANGYASIPITDTVPGDAWVDASINPGGVINGSSAIARFTPAADVNNPNTQLIVVIQEALADGSSTTAVKAHIVDANGNPVANTAVQFAIDSGTAVIITTQPVVTDANGDATIYLTSTTVGDALVTATVGGKAIIFGSPARVSFTGVNIYVPRAFSPNNDGTNDLLKPILVGIQTFHYFTVYNRWGNIVFTTTDPNQGWDGTFKGVPQPVETYLWIAEGIGGNGKKIVAKGMTSLVR
jgi:gliding motility-associated-like protein